MGSERTISHTLVRARKHRKKYGCGRTKPEATNSATFGVEASAERCELKRYKLRRGSCLLEWISSLFRTQFRLCQLFALIGSDFSFVASLFLLCFTTFRFPKCFYFATEDKNSHNSPRPHRRKPDSKRYLGSSITYDDTEVIGNAKWKA